MIPLIIHQSGPVDLASWHPLWRPCADSWRQQFHQWQHRFWNDTESDALVRDHYPQYWPVYQDFPLHIMRIDFARFCMLHHHGGVYADLDVFCYQNFADEIPSTVTVVENPCGNDPWENSLMSGPPGHEFWLRCMDLSCLRWYRMQKKYPQYIFAKDSFALQFDIKFRPLMVFYVTGTNLISTVMREYITQVCSFPGHLYNNQMLSWDPLFRTKHIHTGAWGAQDGDDAALHLELQQRQVNLGLDSQAQKPDLADFDFQHDYTQGRYAKKRIWHDLWRNFIDDGLSPGLGQYV